MNSEKLSKLESFVERHRPDFDAHEPSPDLWARLEQELAAPGPGVGPVRLAEPEAAPLPTPAAAPQETAAPRFAWLSRYGVAAALAALVFAAGLSEARRARTAADTVASTALPAPVATPEGNVPSTYLGPPARALAAYEHDDSPSDARLTAAVRGMETYYAAQLTERQAELRQLDAQNPAADWPRELAALDSSYRVLKAELLHHPQPQAVLTAMNRNLQIRLDILDQQLSHRAPDSQLATRDEYGSAVLADSRR